MNRLRDLSIRWKLLVLIALSSFLSLALTGAAMIAYDAAQFKRASINAVTAQAELLASISAAALVFNDPKAATEYLATLRARVSTLCAATYAADGSVFAVYERNRSVPCEMPAMQPDGWRIEGDDLLVFTKVEQGGQQVGTVYMRHNLDRSERVLSSTGIVLAVLLSALLVALLVSSRLQRVISQPLMEIADVARGVTERRDYSLRAVKRGEDEVGVLTDAFNQMLAQIERSAAELQRTNQQLKLEIADHQQARQQVLALNATLEHRVAQRTQQLELANKELESFSYSVSHDLRAPLRAIEGFSAALSKMYEGQLDERGQDYLQRVRAATRRMGVLIDDLLELARTSRAELRRREVDLSVMAQGVAAEIAAVQPERAVQWDIAPDLKTHADPQLMRAVLDNLLGNAVKFSGKRPDARVVFNAEQEGGRTVYVVRDNGVGFDMAYAGKLFGAFQRLHAADEFEGTGVGLANVQRIIHRHGGRVWAESEPGEGASFYFTLPTT